MPRSFYDLLQTIASLKFTVSTTIARADDERCSMPPPPSMPPPSSQREDLEDLDCAYQQSITSCAETCFSRSRMALDREIFQSRDSITADEQRDDSDTTSIWSLRPGSFISQRDADELAAISRLLRMRFEREGSRLERQAEQGGTRPPSTHVERSPSAARQLSCPEPHPGRPFCTLPDTRHASLELLDRAGLTLAESGESVDCTGSSSR